jgi:signal recognition particle receptor subunit beta
MGQCRSSFNVLVLGLTDSGKTTLLRGIEASSLPSSQTSSQTERRVTTTMISPTTPTAAPTFCHDHTTVRLENGITLFFDEIPANDRSRGLWPEFYPNRDALVWVLDVSDPPRYEESIRLLGGVLNGGEGGKGIDPKVLVVIFLNKTDIWVSNNKDGAPVDKLIKKQVRALGAPHTFRYTWNCAKLPESCKNFAEALADDIAEHKDPLAVRVARRLLS